MKEEFTTGEVAEALGVTKQAVHKRAHKEGWPTKNGKRTRGGGKKNLYGPLPSLPPYVQKALVEKYGATPDLLPALAPEAALAAACKMMPLERDFDDLRPAGPDPESFAGLSEDLLRDDRVGKMARIVQEAMNPPREYKRSKWIEVVAVKHCLSRSQIYRYIKV